MDVAVGIDVAKEFHWAVATRLDPSTGKAVSVLSRRVDNVPGDIAVLADELLALAAAGSLQVAIDIVGGIAKLLEVMLTPRRPGGCACARCDGSRTPAEPAAEANTRATRETRV